MNPAADARNALRTWTTDGPGHARGTACFPAALPVFAGHFPGRPLVPGVHQLAALAELVQRAEGRFLVAQAVGRCKWTRPVLPDEVIDLAASWCTTNGLLVVKATTAVAGQQACTVNFTLVVTP